MHTIHEAKEGYQFPRDQMLILAKFLITSFVPFSGDNMKHPWLNEVNTVFPWNSSSADFFDCININRTRDSLFFPRHEEFKKLDRYFLILIKSTQQVARGNRTLSSFRILNAQRIVLITYKVNS